MESRVIGCLFRYTTPSMRRLALHHDRFDQGLEILSPKLRALLCALIEGDLLGYADQLHILQRDDFMFHTFSLLC